MQKKISLKTCNMLLLSALLMTPAIFYGCGEEEVEEEEETQTLVVPTPTPINLVSSGDWSNHGSNPVITVGQEISEVQWNDPSVLKIGTDYVMYLTGNQGDAGENVAPFSATSQDGISWDINTTPLLSAGGASSDFDSKNIETPSVISFDEQYHMYYTGVKTDLSGTMAVGHAVSDNGLTSWQKAGTNPVISPTGSLFDWNGTQTAEPGAVVFNGKVYLYFTGVGARSAGSEPGAKRSIGLAISEDGNTFGEPVNILEQGSAYPASANFEGYSTPSALVYNGKVHLFYDVFLYDNNEVTARDQVALHHAVSDDGISNWTEDEKPLMIRSDFSWTTREIRSPTVMEEEGTLKMWYAGDNILAAGTWGIGYATAPVSSIE